MWLCKEGRGQSDWQGRAGSLCLCPPASLLAAREGAQGAAHLEPQQLILHGPQPRQQQVEAAVGRLGQCGGVEAREGAREKVVLG